ncbi:four-carbon acid sugar kinase family protein [Alicyclobacillus kakegawensis]|uniref:four-carbon acid sugar kinase family protein n=1 Tax=Alicyclobacillus kakegawensis TaxID=392012 RepID=UPI00082ECB06|nr:four-carbon acid sugar kinase family protein [Alicyclobacillus kakegawensis]
MDILVFSDDLTGSNAEAVLFRHLGWRAQTLLRHDQALPRPQGAATIWNTGTRLLPPERAADRVRSMMRLVLQRWGEKTHVAKRIDSTFRGPIGAEAEAMLEMLPPRAVGVVVCAFPASGRTVRDGRLYVHGVPVHETEIGSDVHTPVTTSNLTKLLRAQTRLPIVRLTREEAAQGFQHWAERLGGTDERLLIVCDAESDEDIASLAQSFAAWPVPILPIDPGPFTVHYFSALAARQNRIFVVSGSLMPTTRRQLAYLEEHSETRLLQVDPLALADPDAGPAYIERIAQQVERAFSQERVVGVRTDGNPCEGQAAVDVSRALAVLTETVLARVTIHGLYVSGGEVAYEVLHRLQAEALEPILEVWPLCILSRIVSGPYRDLRVVTKGGSIGPDSAVYDSVRVLLSGA